MCYICKLVFTHGEQYYDHSHIFSSIQYIEIMKYKLMLIITFFIITGMKLHILKD